MSSDTTDDTSVLITDRRAHDSTFVDLEIVIEASRNVVFDYLTVPAKVMSWLGVRGEVEPRPGGRFRVHMSNDNDIAAGEYVEVTRPTTVSWTWGWEGSDEVPPGSTLVTFELSEAAGATTVRLTHSGLPDAESAKNHDLGWKHFFPQLAAVVGRGDPPSDGTDPGDPQ